MKKKNTKNKNQKIQPPKRTVQDVLAKSFKGKADVLPASFLATAVIPDLDRPKQSVDTRTPFQKEAEECSALYKELIYKYPQLLDIVACLISFRRAHAVAYRELHELLQKIENETDKPLPSLFADFITMLFLEVSSKPFNTHELMTGMFDVVLKWLVSVMDKHTAADEAEADKAKQQEHEERMASDIPIGFVYNVLDDSDAADKLPRSVSLILVGWRNAVLWLLDKAAKTASNNFSVLQFSESTPSSGSQHSRLVQVGKQNWVGSANSDRTFATMVANKVVPLISTQLDLVVCADLPEAMNNNYINRPPAAIAGDVHRKMRKWCDQMGSAFLGGVLLPYGETADFGSPEFYQLNTFTALRTVTVKESDNAYLITVGSDASVFSVDKQELDAYTSIQLVDVKNTILVGK